MIFLMIVGSILPWIVPLHFENISTFSLSGIAGYLRFLTKDKNDMIVSIAFHNITIALLSFIVSFLSNGILGILLLFINLISVNMVLSKIHDFSMAFFVYLEIIGIFIAAFIGTVLSSKKSEKNFSLLNIFKCFIALTLVLVIIYFVAAYVECDFIMNRRC